MWPCRHSGCSRLGTVDADAPEPGVAGTTTPYRHAGAGGVSRRHTAVSPPETVRAAVFDQTVLPGRCQPWAHAPPENVATVAPPPTEHPVGGLGGRATHHAPGEVRHETGERRSVDELEPLSSGCHREYSSVSGRINSIHSPSAGQLWCSPGVCTEPAVCGPRFVLPGGRRESTENS